MTRLRAAVLLATLLGVLGCRDSAPPPAQTSAPQAAASSPTAPRQRLPRAVVRVQLGMTKGEAEALLGALSCHDSKAGVRVCKPEQAHQGDVSDIEIYVHHERVISLAYAIETPANAWTFLDRQIEQFGQPSLSGQRSQDQSGRDHEVFGWKDPESLYSIRFTWGEDVLGKRSLLSTTITLWDRRAYQQWEEERPERAQPGAER